MPAVDLPLAELLTYKPELTATADFDAFWAVQKTESANRPLHARVEQVPFPARHVIVFDITYDGIDGTPIHGWYIVPAESLASRPMPVVVGYHGYSGDRGYPSDSLHWATLGVASFTVDTRGQGGQSPDYAVYPHGAAGGWMTKGILDPNRYYYRCAYMDCVRALDFVVSRPEIDANRIAVAGGSQGGGLTLAVAGIDSRPKLALPVFPYLCHFKRAVEMHTDGPYAEIKDWFRRFDPLHSQEEIVFRTLSYFDGMNFAARIRARTQMAITLQDVVCPPSTCFAAYNHLTADKELLVYPDHGHEGLPNHNERLMQFVADHL